MWIHCDLILTPVFENMSENKGTCGCETNLTWGIHPSDVLLEFITPSLNHNHHPIWHVISLPKQRRAEVNCWHTDVCSIGSPVSSWLWWTKLSFKGKSGVSQLVYPVLAVVSTLLLWQTITLLSLIPSGRSNKGSWALKGLAKVIVCEGDFVVQADTKVGSCD
jgi:hypothetical protein